MIEKGRELEQPTVSGRDRVNINGIINAKDVIDVIERTKIIQLFLPPYLPNLNLIERLWRFLRKKVINTHFYRTKELFRQAISKFFENIADYKTELQTLLTLDFRLCNSYSFSLCV